MGVLWTEEAFVQWPAPSNVSFEWVSLSRIAEFFFTGPHPRAETQEGTVPRSPRRFSSMHRFPSNRWRACVRLDMTTYRQTAMTTLPG